MSKLSVEIVTPEKRLLATQADEVIVPGANGLFGVRPNHTPFLSLMEPGSVTLREGGSQGQTFFVGGGFVEVGNDRVLILADSAEPISSIDVPSAQKRLQEAQERLKGMSSDDERFEIEQATVKRETAKLHAVRH